MIRPDATVLLLALLLGACASPSPPMLGAERAEVAMGAWRYRVYHNGWRAEAVRVTPAASPALRPALAAAAAAMEAASGCRIRPGTLYGDAVLAEAMLDCPGRPGAALKGRRTFTPPGS